MADEGNCPTFSQQKLPLPVESTVPSKSQNSSSTCHVYSFRHLATTAYNPAHDTSYLTQRERPTARPQSLSVTSKVREKYQDSMGSGPVRPAPKYRNEAVVHRFSPHQLNKVGILHYPRVSDNVGPN